MSERVIARLAVSLGLAYVALAVIAIVLTWRNGDLLYAIQLLTGLTALTVVGSVLASRRPRNPIGWLLLCAALAGAAAFVCQGLAIHGVITSPGSIPFAPFLMVVGLWFSQGALTLLVYAVYLFPSGSLPSRRWRPVAFGSGLFVLVVTVLFTFGTPGNPPNDPEIANPLFVPALLPVASAIGGAFFLYVFLLALAMASLVARYRAGSAFEKQQLKWIVLAAVLMVGFLGASSIAAEFRGAAFLMAFLVLPTAVAIAILRHRLYDIDHLLKRTLVYGGTSGLIAVLFFAGLVALQPALRPLTEGSDLSVAASTLVAFALFQPIRRRVQDAVDRRFDRSRYDAARTLDAFTEDLRDEVDLDDLKADLIRVVRQTMSPAHASLWLRGRGR